MIPTFIRPAHKNKVELHKREDGRWQVSLGGVVRWCGWSEETAQLWHAVLTAPVAGRLRSDGALHRAVTI